MHYAGPSAATQTRLLAARAGSCRPPAAPGSPRAATRRASQRALSLTPPSEPGPAAPRYHGSPHLSSPALDLASATSAEPSPSASPERALGPRASPAWLSPTARRGAAGSASSSGTAPRPCRMAHTRLAAAWGELGEEQGHGTALMLAPGVAPAERSLAHAGPHVALPAAPTSAAGDAPHSPLASARQAPASPRAPAPGEGVPMVADAGGRRAAAQGGTEPTPARSAAPQCGTEAHAAAGGSVAACSTREAALSIARASGLDADSCRVGFARPEAVSVAGATEAQTPVAAPSPAAAEPQAEAERAAATAADSPRMALEPGLHSMQRGPGVTWRMPRLGPARRRRTDALRTQMRWGLPTACAAAPARQPALRRGAARCGRCARWCALGSCRRCRRACRAPGGRPLRSRGQRRTAARPPLSACPGFGSAGACLSGSQIVRCVKIACHASVRTCSSACSSAMLQQGGPHCVRS